MNNHQIHSDVMFMQKVKICVLTKIGLGGSDMHPSVPVWEVQSGWSGRRYWLKKRKEK